MEVPASPQRSRGAERQRPNSLAIGEKQMDPVESATILALPGVGLAAVEGSDANEVTDEELTRAP